MTSPVSPLLWWEPSLLMATGSELVSQRARLTKVGHDRGVGVGECLYLPNILGFV